MKYFILGSNSFAGSCVVNHFLKNGREVIGVSRSKEPHPIMLAYSANTNIESFQFFQCDINTDFDLLKTLIEKEKPNYIIDLAGQGMVAESWKTPEQWFLTNVVSKVKLHNYLSQCDFLERYVRVSTPEVYGSTGGMVDERCVMSPSTPYAVSHAAIDMNLAAYHKQYQFPMIITRFANFYGPHQQLYRIIPRTIIYALTKKKLFLHGGGTSERAFIFGDDVAAAIDCVIERGKLGETYHFSSGNTISIAGLVEKIASQLSVDFNALVEVSADRPGKDALYSMSTEKSEKELGWSPNTTFDSGLEKTIRWVKDNLSDITTLPLEYIHKA